MAFQITNIRKFITLVVAVVIILAVAGWAVAWGGSSVKKSGEFVIESGTSSRQIWRALAQEGYTSRTLPWKYYSWRKEAADKIQAGAYQLVQGETVKSVVQRFIEGDTVQNELAITYPEGFTLSQIAERTEAKGIGTANVFMEIAAHPEAFAEEFPFLEHIPAGRTLEGYLFPDTYRVFEDDTPEDVIRRMLGTFSQKVIASGIVDGVPASGHTLDEAVIMASIIEREVQTDDDMALVAGVLWARLANGEGLGVDATVRYALDKQTEPLTAQDLAIDSAYNTRKYRGLPPGPISSPGLRAIMAAINPQTSDYYYYLSAPSGETIFSKTLEQHNLNKAKYLQ